MGRSWPYGVRPFHVKRTSMKVLGRKELVVFEERRIGRWEGREELWERHWGARQGAASRTGFVRTFDFILRTIGSFRRVSGRLVTCLAAGGQWAQGRSREGPRAGRSELEIPRRSGPLALHQELLRLESVGSQVPARAVWGQGRAFL